MSDSHISNPARGVQRTPFDIVIHIVPVGVVIALAVGMYGLTRSKQIDVMWIWTLCMTGVAIFATWFAVAILRRANRDTAIQRQTEAALRTSEQRFRRLVSMSSDWYWEQDANFRFVQVSGVRVDNILTPFHKIKGKTRWEVEANIGVSAEQWAAHRATLESHLPFSDFVCQLRAPDGALRWVSISGHPMHDARGKFCGYHGIGCDITERMQHTERFRHLAHHDTLTGLPNRRLLEDRLNQAIVQGRRWNHRVVLMLLDLDHFKIINDNEGHAVGDGVLITVAQRLRGSVREGDTVARLGGDEFVVVLPEIEDSRDAMSVADKIIAAIREPITAGTRQYVLGVSIGIAAFPDHTDVPEKLLSLADSAMYKGKHSGGSACHFAQTSGQPQLVLDFRSEEFAIENTTRTTN
ncbi:MAG TPA: sensor domain-containing diguanylate cyclase [Rhodocyclaceae bacterium]|nr:sensor domain-containing diguanylate cyclase [Rhodocyclaceae bacterium]